MQNYKKIFKIISPQLIKEGTGAGVYRPIGSADLKRLDPFIMFDWASAKLPAGFPDHPHRGFEIVSYSIQGKFYHEDSKGNRGVIAPGDVQRMTTGKGIMHAEMPGSFEEESVMAQLWVNLLKKDKMIDPDYKELKKENIPIVEEEGVKVTVISGESSGKTGNDITKVPMLYLDVVMQPYSSFKQKIPKQWNSWAWLFEGEAYFGQEKSKAETPSAVILEQDENETLVVETKEKGGRFLVLAGQPLNEPIWTKWYYVMNSKEELDQTIDDFKHEKNGFEGAKSWRSEIRNMNKRA